MPFLLSTLTQGSADAFIENSVNTGLSGITNQAYRLLRVDIEFDGAVPKPFASVATSQDVEFSVTRRTKAAMAAITDPQLVMKLHRTLMYASAVGYSPTDNIWRWETPTDSEKYTDGAVLIIEDPVYLQLDTTGTGVANVGSVRIEYDVVKLSTDDRIALLTLALG